MGASRGRFANFPSGLKTLMYHYQETQRYFAQVADDIKDIAEQELRTLGARETSPTYRGIYFSASSKVLYTINFCARLISRVLAPLTSFRCHSDRYLYKKAREIEWQDFLDPSQTFAVFATVANSRLRHSQFAALRLKDAVVDSFRAATGVRPSIDTREPTVWLNLHIHNDEATISLDTSGGSLHRRGYRKQSVQAPLVETLAAAIIQHAEWDGRQPLYDPLCGSGTLLCEAYMSAARMPAGLFRQRFGFQALPDFDAGLWRQVQEDGGAACVLLRGPHLRPDIDPEPSRARVNSPPCPPVPSRSSNAMPFRFVGSTTRSLCVIRHMASAWANRPIWAISMHAWAISSNSAVEARRLSSIVENVNT